jgi:hypothetical protein
MKKEEKNKQFELENSLRKILEEKDKLENELDISLKKFKEKNDSKLKSDNFKIIEDELNEKLEIQKEESGRTIECSTTTKRKIGKRNIRFSNYN